MKSFSPVCNSCTIMPAAAIMASRDVQKKETCIEEQTTNEENKEFKETDIQ